MSPEAVVLSSAVAVPLTIVALGIIGAKLLVRRGLARKAVAGAGNEADFNATLRRVPSRVRADFGVETTGLASPSPASAVSPLTADALASISKALSETTDSDVLKAEVALQAALLSAQAADELQLRDLERRLSKYESIIAASEASAARAESEDQSAEEGASRTQARP
ncbi:hypothetical protein [Rhodopseudomonas sp. BR0M22]|uniref:hypothetical protein n=1 Tax=Rhodopseudomonas sp. BR0M22 TaxID=2269369 RepID=UPI0013DEF800|nr:hypothetical protein [Rhodopseudomonas sp. BR0M22]